MAGRAGREGAVEPDGPEDQGAGRGPRDDRLRGHRPAAGVADADEAHQILFGLGPDAERVHPERGSGVSDFQARGRSRSLNRPNVGPRVGRPEERRPGHRVRAHHTARREYLVDGREQSRGTVEGVRQGRADRGARHRVRGQGTVRERTIPRAGKPDIRYRVVVQELRHEGLFPFTQIAHGQQQTAGGRDYGQSRSGGIRGPRHRGHVVKRKRKRHVAYVRHDAPSWERAHARVEEFAEVSGLADRRRRLPEDRPSVVP